MCIKTPSNVWPDISLYLETTTTELEISEANEIESEMKFAIVLLLVASVACIGIQVIYKYIYS